MSEYIEREAVLNALCTVSAPTPTESWVVEKCIEKVNEAPAADVVERKRGKWKLCKDEWENEWYECTICGRRPLWTYSFVNPLTDFCPHCGADLREEVDHEGVH